MEVASDIPPEVWLRSKVRRYIFIAVVMGIGSAAVVIVVAIMHRQRVEQVKVADITATLTVDNGEQGNPCPPSLTATTLRLIGSTRRVGDKARASWADDAITTPAVELSLTALGSEPVLEDRGEQAHETCYRTIKFNGFSGDLNVFARPDQWQNATLEAVVDGSGNGAEWNEFYNVKYLPDDHGQLQKDFRRFYGLADSDETFGQSTGLEETVSVFVNGRNIGSAQGIVARSGVGFHGIPETYTVKTRPFSVASGIQVPK